MCSPPVCSNMKKKKLFAGSLQEFLTKKKKKNQNTYFPEHFLLTAFAVFTSYCFNF